MGIACIILFVFCLEHKRGVVLMNRWMRLFQDLQKNGCTQAILTPGASFAYLTGWATHASERLTMVGCNALGQTALLCPLLEAEGAKVAGIANCHVYSDETGPDDALKAFAQSLGVTEASIVAVEERRMRLFEVKALQVVGFRHFMSCDQAVSSLRVHKEKYEIEAIRRAARMVDEALALALPMLRVGVSELDIAAELEYQMKRLGSEGAPFATIVGAGANGALPHSSPTGKKLASGDLVVLDFGAMSAGYAADTTRTVAVGEPGAEARKVYATVQRAQAAAVARSAPGVPVADIDAAARSIIAEAGYGAYFTHRTGHGLGLDVHEYPDIMAGNDLPLASGMVFTVEPGIYLPGRLGVRIEDDVLVTERGAEILTQFSRDLLVIG